jgi:predicted phosphohydrolase
MRLTVYSDLHINFDTGDTGLELPGGDVLLLCGDVLEAGHIRVAQNKGRGVSTLETYQRFCDCELTKYDQVLYIFGNHEYYNHDFSTARQRIEPLLPPNVTILQNSYVKIEDYLIWGATMWTDNDRGNPIARQQISGAMSDYTMIKHDPGRTVQGAGGEYWTSKFTVHDSEQEHRFSRGRLEEFLLMYPNHKTIVMTHHAPSYESISAEYRDHVNGWINHAYYSDFTNTILDNPQIKLWAHGHVHCMNDYMLGSTRVVSNPRGYNKYEQQAQRFDLDSKFLTIELD